MKSAEYNDDLPDYGDRITTAQYKACCKSRAFIDYDGYGHPVKDNKMAVQVIVQPSACPGDIPEDATHIMWFNR